MPRSAAALTADLSALAELAVAADRAEVDELCRRLGAGMLRVLVVGEAKRGKSTLLNALLGRPVLPTGVLPLTAIATTLAYGATEAVAVRYADGREEQRGLDSLRLVTEAGNPHNRCAVAAVTVHLPVPLLARGVELVDTPGTGSVYAHNTAAAGAARNRMDAAILVLSVDPPITAAERAMLRRLDADAVALFGVLNKVDYFSVAEAAAAQEFTQRVLADELGREMAVWPVSARRGLDARVRGDEAAVRSSGLAAFEAEFTRYLVRRHDTDLVRSVAGRAARLAGAIAEEAAATLAGLAMSGADLQRRIAAFTEELARVEQSRATSAALAGAEFDRLLAGTNDQAAALGAEATAPLQRAVLTHLDDLPGPLGAAEQAALDFAAARIREVVGAWRERRAAELDAAVRALDERLAGRLEEHIGAVRHTAATLFDLELGALPPAGRLVESSRFSYAFAADPGQADALAAAIRSHLPGALGRRRVAGHVTDQVARLLDRQLGRARADFQDRLAGTRRLLLRASAARFDAGAGRIAEAVRRGGALRDEHGATAAAVRTEVAARRDVAATLSARLHRDTGSEPAAVAGG